MKAKPREGHAALLAHPGQGSHGPIRPRVRTDGRLAGEQGGGPRRAREARNTGTFTKRSRLLRSRPSTGKYEIRREIHQEKQARKSEGQPGPLGLERPRKLSSASLFGGPER